MEQEDTTNKKSNNRGILKKYALIIIDIKGLGNKVFTYSVPEDIREKIRYGSPVSVVFGAKGLVNGVVVGFSETAEESIKIKPITDILDEEASFTPEYMQLLFFVSKKYLCDLNTVIQAAAPSGLFGKYKTYVRLTSEERRRDITPEELKILQILSPGEQILSLTLKKKTGLAYERYSEGLRKLKRKKLITTENIITEKSAKQKFEKHIVFKEEIETTKRGKELLRKLKESGEVKVSKFLQTEKTTPETLKKLAEAGGIEIIAGEVTRVPEILKTVASRTDFPPLTDEQESVYNFIVKKAKERECPPILIHGVTGSGKTEIYFALMKKVTETGKNVLFLLPETALATMFAEKVAERFGAENTAIWHSFISAGEKCDIRRRLQRNEVKILTGARSAIFAPLKDIGLIVVDEEHDGAYKQKSPAPLYNAVEVAEEYGRITGATVVKGSATPDICSYYRAKESGCLCELKTRYNNVRLCNVEIVDMREEISTKGQRIFSRHLTEAIRSNLENKKQTILLMNRLGYSTRTICPECGEILKCPKCSIPLIYHKKKDILKCHRCEYETRLPESCPTCGSPVLRYSGGGTEKIEAVAAKIFPTARIARFDSEAMTSKFSHAEILSDFKSGKIDILIGTQMSAKGLDNEKVTLAGVINADASFIFPDFRSSERGFQLLTQTAGRSGRGRYGGRVIFQTFNPDFPVIENAKKQDYKSFYEEEIQLRREFNYPPFTEIIRITVTGKDEAKAEQSASLIADKLKELVEKKSKGNIIEVRDSMPCAIEKMNEEYRFDITVKNSGGKKGLAFIGAFSKIIKSEKDVRIAFDTSPLDLL